MGHTLAGHTYPPGTTCEPPHAMRNRMLRLVFTGVQPETGVSNYCWNQARRADQFRDYLCGWVLTCKRQPELSADLNLALATASLPATGYRPLYGIAK